MAVRLTLRHLWTNTGTARDWNFDDDDERELLGYLARLDSHAAPIDSRRAVLLATTDNGKTVGAWDRAGCDALASMIDAEPHPEEWLDLRHSLRDAVSGP